MPRLLLLLLVLPACASAQSFEATVAKAEKARKRGESESAIEHYSTALKVWHRSDGTRAKAAALRARADLFERSTEFERALADLTAALKLQPKNGPLLRRRGELFLRLNRPAQAITDFYNATAVNLEDKDAYFGRGVAYELQGDIKFAHEDYRTACRLGMKSACKNAADAKKKLLRPLSEVPEFEEISQKGPRIVEVKKPKKKRRYVLDFQACLDGLNGCLEEGDSFGVCVRRHPVCEHKADPGCCPSACVKEFEQRAASELSEAQAFREIYRPDAPCSRP